MRIAIFGANGATGRLLVGQALAAEHEVVAVTRNPDAFPIAHGQLWVAEADAHDQEAVARRCSWTGPRREPARLSQANPDGVQRWAGRG